MLTICETSYRIGIISLFHYKGIIMPIAKSNFLGDTNVGLYGFATDRYGVCGIRSRHMERTLGVKFHLIPLYGMRLSSLFAAGNSYGIVASNLLGKSEIVHMKSIAKVLLLDTSYTAIGNLVLLNDKGIVISPLLRKFKKEISEFFSLRCEVSTIAGIAVVGSVAVATNNGCIVHPRIRSKEKKILDETLQVPLTIGTVSFGSPFVKSGLIANKNGAIVSERSSGIELGNINDAFGF